MQEYFVLRLAENEQVVLEKMKLLFKSVLTAIRRNGQWTKSAMCDFSYRLNRNNFQTSGF